MGSEEANEDLDVGMRAYDALLKMGASIGTSGVQKAGAEEEVNSHAVTTCHVVVTYGTELIECKWRTS